MKTAISFCCPIPLKNKNISKEGIIRIYNGILLDHEKR